MWPYIVTDLILIIPTDALISKIYFGQETLHVSGSSSAHHQEFSTVHLALVYVTQVWWQLSSTNCPKHVEFLDKNKFGKLVGLLVLLKRNLVLNTQISWHPRYPVTNRLHYAVCPQFFLVLLLVRSRQSVVDIVSRLRAWWPTNCPSIPSTGKRFSFSLKPPDQAYFQWVPGVKRPGCETGHSF